MAVENDTVDHQVTVGGTHEDRHPWWETITLRPLRWTAALPVSERAALFECETEGGVSLWDVAVSYPVTSHLTVRGKIANLFDKDYETVYGYQTAGREYTLSGSYTF